MNLFRESGSLITYILDKGLIKNHKTDDLWLNDKIFDVFTNIFSIIAIQILNVMNSGEKRLKVNDPFYEDRKKISLEAHASGCLIQSVLTHRLYTPKEFLNSGEKVTYTRLGLENYPSVTRLYPGYILESRVKMVEQAKEELTKAEADLQDVIKKVITTFDFKPKSKR